MIHKTKKEEGKKHINMPLRWEFWLFWRYSRSILACFGHFSRWPIRPDSGRISSVRRKLAWIEAESVRIREKKKKKKKLRCGTDARATVSRVGLKCDTLPAVFMLSRLWFIYYLSQISLHRKLTKFYFSTVVYHKMIWLSSSKLTYI